VIDLGFCLEEDEELSYDQVRFRRNAVARLAIEQADLVVAVSRADPVGLHDLIRAYESARELGVGPDRLRLVVNQVRGSLFGGDPVEQIRAALVRYVGVEPVAFIPYDRAGMDAALEAGQALREARPGCPSQRAIGALAAALFGSHAGQRGSRRRRRRLIQEA
jgi:Flp pilus assembly CpaE family ATPase